MQHLSEVDFHQPVAIARITLAVILDALRTECESGNLVGRGVALLGISNGHIELELLERTRQERKPPAVVVVPVVVPARFRAFWIELVVSGVVLVFDEVARAQRPANDIDIPKAPAFSGRGWRVGGTLAYKNRPSLAYVVGIEAIFKIYVGL